MLADLRFALRSFRRSPGLIAAAILATALGVGANTAIFSVIQKVLLQPLPYRDPARLAMVWEKNPVFKGFLAERLPVAGRNYTAWKQQAHSFSGLAAMRQVRVVMTGADRPEDLEGVQITADFLPVLGRAPVLGRSFTADETVAGKDQVALVSYAFFEHHLGGDPHRLGSKLELDGKAYTMIGVLPRDFHLPALFQGFDVRHPQIWLPMSETFNAAQQTGRVNYVVARLRDGTTFPQARAEMAVIARGLAAQDPKLDTGFSASVFPLSVEDVSPSTSRTVLALQVAVGFVLLIACANVANLLLARAAGRGREMAIRAALGATRARLMRQALGESVLLSAAGGALGLLLAVGAMAGIRALAPSDNYHFHEVGLNWMVLGFAIAVSLFSGIIFGLAPAIGASAANIQETLAQGGRAGAGRKARRLSNSLVVAEVALALVLLAGAGLMLRSLSNVLGVNPGFQAAHVLTMHIRLPGARYSGDDALKSFNGKLLDGVRHLPGVESAAVASGLPLLDSIAATTYRVEGDPEPADPAQAPETDTKLVSEDYFRTIGTPILRGRAFTRQDAEPNGSPIVAVTLSLARQIAPRGDALGRKVLLGGGDKAPVATVVAIVPDTRELGLDESPRPEMFIAARNIQEAALMLHTRGDPMALESGVRAVVAGIDRDLPVVDVMPLAQHLHGTTQERRFDSLLFTGFAGLALLLAAVGLYGVLSYSVTLRTREIGVRIALGARGGDVVGLILRHGLLMVLLGTVAGALGALVLTQWMQSLVFGMSATDPLTFAAVAALLLVVAAIACYVPARRASRMDPIRALRAE
ncbi:MAG TPA: ABC transporter permease [Bryobacteraceae bacterium]|jgi:putative ABC transport system permease protein|nr:ABC transporter permease [Bryobacteraceae bacterium]